MARLDKTIKDYQEQLKNKGIKNIPDFVQSILDADITKGKYSRFLLDCYLADKFRMEDLKGGLTSTIGEAITLFHKHKNKLPEEQRSIYRYDSPGSLWSAVKQFDGELSGKEVKRDEKDKIYAETEFLYEDKETGLKIISPLTIEAAKWWGKGTRWCTSAENNNQFKNYAQDAPLLIFLMPDGQKLQLWKNGGDIQFMDEADDDIQLEYIEQNWEVLEPIIMWLDAFKFIPSNYINKELCEKAIQNNEDIFLYISEDMVTEELCKLAVQKKGLTLQSIPEQYLTDEICKLAIESNGRALFSVPEHLKTEELCKIAVQKNGWALQNVPEHMITEKLCRIAIQQNGNALCSVPKEMRTKELCQLVVEQEVWSLQDIPEHMRTEEFCKLALQKYGLALRHIPEHFKTEEMCKMAVQKNGMAIRYIPKNMLTEELCKLTVQQNGLDLEYVPEDMITEELCKLAVEQNGKSLLYVPTSMRTKELCTFAVQQHGGSLQFVPIDLRTEELCKIAVQQNEQVLYEVPKQWQEKMKQYIKPSILPQEKYQQVFSEIRSCFTDKSLSLTM